MLLTWGAPRMSAVLRRAAPVWLGQDLAKLGGAHSPEENSLNSDSCHCHAQGHLWVSQPTCPFPQRPSQLVHVPRKKILSLPLLQLSVPALGQCLQALTCAHL